MPATRVSRGALVSAAAAAPVIAAPPGAAPIAAAAVAAAAVEGARDEPRVQAAWWALAAVPDPELPALTLADLGIVRFVDLREDGTLEVGLSPTYTGCPATDHIAELARRALEE